jgi:hypothetical protein
MKKLFLALILLLPFAFACNNHKEVEMALPTPIPTATPIVTITPTTVYTSLPTATATPSLEYSIEDIKGTGLILLVDTTVPESAAEGESVQIGDELITKDDSEMTLALNDNTMVHIAADSQVRVADLAPNTSQGFTSRLELLMGNILSEVEKLNESKSSFEIEAGGVVCAVRGTAFEVQKQGDVVSTSTFHGNVEMEKDGHKQSVPAFEHSTFSLKNACFSAQRDLKPSEIKRYRTWVKAKAVIQHKRAARINGGRMPQNHPGQKMQTQRMGNTGNHHPEAKVRTGQRNQHNAQAKNNRETHSPSKNQSGQQRKINHQQNQPHRNNNEQGQPHRNSGQPSQTHRNNIQQNQAHRNNNQQNQAHRNNNPQNQQHRNSNQPHQNNHPQIQQRQQPKRQNQSGNNQRKKKHN